MRFVVTVAIFQLAISSCYAMTGVIWHKQKQKFVQMFSIPQFAAFREENLTRQHSLKTQNLKGEVVKVVYYQVRTYNSSKMINIQLFLLQDVTYYLSMSFTIRSTMMNF